MKVLFVTTRYYPHAVGGAEATVKLLAEGIVRTGDAAVVVTLAPDGRHTERMVKGVRVHYLPLFNVFFPHGPKRQPVWRRTLWQMMDAYNPVMARRLCAVVDREAPDLVNLHNLMGFSCAVWPRLARRRLPVVQTLHDHYTACANSVMYRNGRNCATRCRSCQVLCAPRVRLSRKIDAVTSVSARLLQRLGSSGVFRTAADVRVIHNCNADPIRTAAREPPDPSRPLRLGLLGRLEPIKGVEILLEAVERIGPGRVQLRLGGTGQPDYEDRLKARFAGPGIDFLGRVPAAEFFGAIDLLVVPSLVEEALGRVVHEAFGAGVPVIGVSIGGIPEMIREGETGFLVPPGDAPALERILTRLIETPPDWPAMSAACLVEAERFTFDRIFGEYRAAWDAARRSLRTMATHGTASMIAPARPTPP